jgi:hypothetical protein
MADKILTLCDSCAELMRGSFDVQQTSGGSFRRSLHGRKCENCEQKTFVDVHSYIVRSKKGTPLDE